MKVIRKFNLASIGRQYENVSIEIEGERMSEIIVEIENAFKTYVSAIKNGLVQ